MIVEIGDLKESIWVFFCNFTILLGEWVEVWYWMLFRIFLKFLARFEAIYVISLN